MPAYWKRSVDIATAWERTLAEAPTPHTRKVALRTAMVMAPRGDVATTDNIFSVLSTLTRLGLGGAVAGGRQYVSWIHGDDFCAAADFILDHAAIEGPVNVAAPNPLPQREFMAALREALHVRMGLPATAWMLAIGAAVMNSDPELLLKSRRVVPGRLLDAGFTFTHPSWRQAVVDLAHRSAPAMTERAVTSREG